ncbi:MAG: hypothetical protein ACRD3T_19550, partial [Terriglobia bacterium]
RISSLSATPARIRAMIDVVESGVAQTSAVQEVCGWSDAPTKPADLRITQGPRYHKRNLSF